MTRQDAFEEAARVCERMAEKAAPDLYLSVMAKSCAAAIRSRARAEVVGASNVRPTSVQPPSNLDSEKSL